MGVGADWGPEPTRFPPQMCFNSPEIRAAVTKRASLIGAEVKKELDTLKAAGKEHLFANLIAGWENAHRPRLRNRSSTGLSSLLSVGRRGNFPAFSSGPGNRLRQPVGPRVQAQQANDRTLRLGQLGHHHLGLPLTDPNLVPLDRREHLD